MNGDRIFGAVMLLVALGYVLSAMTIQTPFFPDPVGPKMVPFMIAGGVAICAGYMIIKPDHTEGWPGRSELASLGLATLVMILYAYGLKPLGFLIPTAIAAGVLSYLLSPRAVAAAVTGVGLSIGLFIIFKYALGLGLQPIPKGWL